MLLEENTVWFDIGEMDSDRYEEQQIILHKIGLPFRYPPVPFVFPNNTFIPDEDVPF